MWTVGWALFGALFLATKFAMLYQCAAAVFVAFLYLPRWPRLYGGSSGRIALASRVGAA
jgi:hypothetical protein